jgi:acyl-CoA reductase-like NAD-dependent aldehyde dehydrogenase
LTDSDLASIADARALLGRARKAFEAYRGFDQARVDRIVHAAVEAGYGAARRLAEMAVEETRLGTIPGKTAKNRFATRGLWAAIRGMRTCGILSEDPVRGVTEVAHPFGVVAAIIPTTNPTSTALFKALICLKSRNAMVASPHPRAARCIAESIRVIAEAATAAGAPADLVSCMTAVALEGTQELMRHRETDVILATGGSGLVKEAYSSGKPAFGVGPGNVPVYVDRSADPAFTARCLVDSKTFDHGTICASEQAVVADRPIAARLLEELRRRGAYVCGADEVKKLDRVVLHRGGMNPAIVGLSAYAVAALAGFAVPEATTVLIAPAHGVGPEHPVSHEKLCPLLAWYEVDGHEEGCRRALEILRYGGLGHTLVLHGRDEAILRAFALEKPVNRLVVNSPSSQGAVGFTTELFPSMTLGCGSFGGNITSDNIGPQHLLNIKRVARAKPSYVDGSLTDEFPYLPPVSAADAAPTASPWEAPFRARPGAESAFATSAAEARPPENPARSFRPAGAFSRDDLRSIIAAKLGEGAAARPSPPAGGAAASPASKTPSAGAGDAY